MTGSEERQVRAYRGGASVTKDRMRREAPLDAAALDAVEASDIVVVGGAYDHVERVLGALEMPFTAVHPGQLAEVRLRPGQLFVVNCPGDLPARQVARIADLVGEGGSLFTTDWALRHVIEVGFPGLVSYNSRPTADDVVRIEVLDHDNPFLKGVMDEEDDPQWWLEGSSYPIRIHDTERVRVLIRSSELESKYGEAPVAILFSHGEGEVFHMISHYYLQRTDLRSERHSASAMEYAESKGAAFAADIAPEMADLSLGEVEAAASSSRLFANVVASHKRKFAKDSSDAATDKEDE
jgi:hypothetical protein